VTIEPSLNADHDGIAELGVREFLLGRW